MEHNIQDNARLTQLTKSNRQTMPLKVTMHLKRYFNHLDSQIKHEQWSNLQQQILFQLHMQHGNRWTIIAQQLKGRTQNTIKNHFYSKLRKSQRRLNKIIVEQNQQYKLNHNQIKTSFIYKIIECAEEKFKITQKEYQQQLIQLAIQLKNRLFLYEDELSDQFTNKKQHITNELLRCIRQFQQKLKNELKRANRHKQGQYLTPKSIRSNSINYSSGQQNSSVYSTASYNSSQQIQSQDQDPSPKFRPLIIPLTQPMYSCFASQHSQPQVPQQSGVPQPLTKSMQLQQSKSERSLFYSQSTETVQQFMDKRIIRQKSAFIQLIENQPHQNNIQHYQPHSNISQHNHQTLHHQAHNFQANQINNHQQNHNYQGFTFSPLYDQNQNQQYFKDPQFPDQFCFQLRILSPKKSQQDKIDEEI